jgi:cytochrome c-type biogenesis protein CcmF
VVGTYARWKSDSLADLVRKLGGAALLSLVLGCSLPLLAGPWSALAALGLSLALWIVLTSLQQIYRQLRDTVHWKSTPWSFWGMHIAHIGIAVSVVGVTMVKGYETEKDVRMGVGDTVAVGGYTFKLTGIREAMGPNYRADVGDVELSRDGQMLRLLHPEKRTYFSSTMPMTEAAIDTGLTRDVYVSLGERLQDGDHPAWAMRVYYKPFVSWIWGGSLLMALGGALAALDRRYRKKRASATSGAAIKGVAA